jgi:predicted transcriptional regulator
MPEQQLVALTADIVAAHLTHNKVAVSDVPDLIQQVHGALSTLGKSVPKPAEAKVPAVSLRASVRPEYLVCLECGAKQSSLKRHLQSAHGMTPERYRHEFGLPGTYPMIAPKYSERRSAIARAMGLGRKKAEATGQPEEQGTEGQGVSGSRKARRKKPPAGAEIPASATPPE